MQYAAILISKRHRNGQFLTQWQWQGTATLTIGPLLNQSEYAAQCRLVASKI